MADDGTVEHLNYSGGTAPRPFTFPDLQGDADHELEEPEQVLPGPP